MASSRIFPSCLVLPAPPWKRAAAAAAAARQFPATRAKKEEEEALPAEKSTTSAAFSLSSAASTLARPAIAAFALGFLDAGSFPSRISKIFPAIATVIYGSRYSGDWSRIGAISMETEEFLKIAAYFVVPLCLLLIYFISDGKKDSLKE